MIAPETWKLFELYKDFVVNALDLLSFALITPELLRLTMPGLVNVVSVTLSLLVFLMSCSGLIFVLWLYFYGTNESWLKIGSLFVLSWLVFGIFIWLMDYSIIKIENTGAWLKRNAFIVGIALFLISRLVGLSISAHQAFFHEAKLSATSTNSVV